MRQKSNGTHLILMELMMVLFFFCNLWIDPASGICKSS